jgi:large conductance mechanosensitive channel
MIRIGSGGSKRGASASGVRVAVQEWAAQIVAVRSASHSSMSPSGGRIMLEQFKKFLVETNAIALAVGVVIGGAVSKLVAALVADIIMPLISLVLPGGAWREWSISLGAGHDPLKIGDVLGTTIDFLIIAWVVFVIVSRLVKVPAK